jgi:hypothetical protein
MNASIISQSAALPEASTAAESLRLSRRVSLMLILAVSLGLWAAIWAAGASVVSAVIG